MLDSMLRRAIEADLQPLSKYEVIVHGSVMREDFIPARSDIDIAIITRSQNKQQNLKTWRDALGLVPPRYDVRVLELLPLHVVVSIIHEHDVLFGNKIDISEYFYEYRKRWETMRRRYAANQFATSTELREAIQARQALLERLQR
jgi:uncharacterized protein